MKFLHKKRNLAAVLGILAVVLIGSAVVAQTYLHAKHALIAEHDNHLTDLAHSIDQNLDNLLTIYREVLDQTVKGESFRNAEHRWQESGDDTAIRSAMSSNPVTMSNGVASMLAIYQSHYKILRFGDPHDYIFPYKNYYENIWLCEDEEGRSYLAIIQPSENEKIRYAALIDLNTLYDYLIGEELRSGYAFQLYDSTSRLLMYNDQMDLEALRIGRDTAEAQGGGIDLLVSAERSEKAAVGSYTLTEGAESAVYRISVLSTSENRNGIFGISVAVSYEIVYGDLSAMLARLIFCFVIIAASLLFLSILIMWTDRREREARAQLKKLKQQNDAMTELVEKTEQLAHHQRLELIGTMTSSLSHEVNNMLTPIMGYSIMAMEKLPEGKEQMTDELADELTDYLSEIYNSSSRAKQLITRISSLSRKQSGQVFAVISPDDLLEKVLMLAQPSVPKKVNVTRRFGAGEKCIRANELQLQQAFLNIILNALDAMRASGGTLTIATEMTEDSVTVRISDTGCGIPEELLPRIYEPFFTTKDVGKGTGLGLAIAAQAVEDHGAEMEVNSRPGEGTEFRLRFARVEPESPSEHDEEKPGGDTIG